MHKIIFLNGSPRSKNSTSTYLMSIIKEQLVGDFSLSEIHIASLTTRDQLERTFESLSTASTILLACPLYVDGLPSHLIAFLEGWESYNLTLEKPPYTPLYVLMNNGFIEGAQNHLALDMLTYFCDKARLTWGVGIGIGGGEFMKASPMPLTSSVKHGIYETLCMLAQELTTPTLIHAPHIFQSPKLNKRLFQLTASSFWIYKAYSLHGKILKLGARPLKKK